MIRRMTFLAASCMVMLMCIASSVSAQPPDPPDPGKESDSIPLLAPLGDETEIKIQPGVATWIAYFKASSNWLLTVAVGFCVIWVVYGGVLIMISGADPGLRQEGQDRIKWAIVGLLMLLFSGFILRTLNSLFFV